MSDAENGGMEVVELDTVPSEEDQGVKNVLQDLESHLQMKGNINMIKSVGEYLYVSTNAAAKDAKQLVQIQDCLFNVIKLNDACALMLQSFQSGANNILEKLKIAYLYLLDGFPDFAMADIEAISKDIGMMKEAVGKHMKSEKTLSEMITGTHDVVKTELEAIPPRIWTKKSQENEKEEEIRKHEEESRRIAADDDGVAEPPELESHTRNRRVSKLYLILLLAAVMKSYFWCHIFDKGMLVPDRVPDSFQTIMFIVPIITCLLLFIVRKKRGVLNLSLACTILFLLLLPGLNRQLQPEAVTEATTKAQNNDVKNQFSGTPEADLVHQSRRLLHDVKTKDNEHAHEPNGRGDRPAKESKPTDGQNGQSDEPAKEHGNGHEEQPVLGPKENEHKDGPANENEQKQTRTDEDWYTSSGEKSGAQQTADSSKSEGSRSEGEIGKSTISDPPAAPKKNGHKDGPPNENEEKQNTCRIGDVWYTSNGAKSGAQRTEDSSKSEGSRSEGEMGKSTISGPLAAPKKNGHKDGPPNENEEKQNTCSGAKSGAQQSGDSSKSEGSHEGEMGKSNISDADSQSQASSNQGLGMSGEGSSSSNDSPSVTDQTVSAVNEPKDDNKSDSTVTKKDAAMSGEDSQGPVNRPKNEDIGQKTAKRSILPLLRGFCPLKTEDVTNTTSNVSKEGFPSSRDNGSATGQTASAVNRSKDDKKPASTAPKTDDVTSTTSDLDSQGSESSKGEHSSSNDGAASPTGQNASAVNTPDDDSKPESTTPKEETGERTTSDEDDQGSTQGQESEEEEYSTTEGVPPDSQFAGKYPGGEYEDNSMAVNKFLSPVAFLMAVRFDEVKFGWVDLQDWDDSATESKAFCVTLAEQNRTACIVHAAGSSLFEKGNGTCHGLDSPYLNFLKVCFKPRTLVNRSKCSQPSLLLLFALTVVGFTVFLVLVVVVSLALRCFRRDKPKPVVDEEVMDDESVRLTKEELSAIAREKTEIAQRELSKIRTELKQEEELLGSAELTNVLFTSCLPYLTVIEGILSNSINLVENWYKECKDVIEPNVGRNITRAADIKEEDRSRYWNSLQFKKEVIGYYCRWRALQVYCGESRGLIRSTRRTIEGWYTENLRPNEAVIKSWQQAAALKDDDVQSFLRERGRAQ